jgi:hypothetical protein
VNRRRVVPCLAAWLAFAACDESSAPLPDCPESVDVIVGAGLEPSFDWLPRCQAGSLRVEVRLSDGGSPPVWILQTVDFENRVVPPVRYGEIPQGTEVIGDRVPLATGSNYRVWLLAVFPRDDGSGVELRATGVAEFQR